MKKILLIAGLVGGFSFVSHATEAPNGSKSKIASASSSVTSSVRRINSVTICKDCGNGNSVCGTGSDAGEARRSLNTAVKAGC